MPSVKLVNRCAVRASAALCLPSSVHIVALCLQGHSRCIMPSAQRCSSRDSPGDAAGVPQPTCCSACALDASSATPTCAAFSPPTSLVPSPHIRVTQPTARRVCSHHEHKPKSLFQANVLAPSHDGAAHVLPMCCCSRPMEGTDKHLAWTLVPPAALPLACSTSSFCSGLTRAKTCTRGMTFAARPQPSTCANASPAHERHGQWHHHITQLACKSVSHQHARRLCRFLTSS